ncbi:hypothetical protein [Mastigocoleus testarum]|uniref:Uncharacterized protein n=1 Tax=Mastigocoleus testarum BC008 TaxID=371196 RepID=A0A0V7ZN41_9CYAN|nr:hypothetical protein [Mastigocoleus testarum]KST65864.1 hypothetical protein BC008_23075 [Mastigocoleus testarum BC008]
MFAETRFISASVIVLLLGVQLVTPKISQAIANLTDLTLYGPKAVASHGTAKTRSHHFSKNNELDEEFQPPDYGGPDSERGSGSR